MFAAPDKLRTRAPERRAVFLKRPATPIFLFSHRFCRKPVPTFRHDAVAQTTTEMSHWTKAVLQPISQIMTETFDANAALGEAHSKSKVTVWFDGACILCRSEIAIYRKLDAKKGRVAFIDLTASGQSDGACPLDPADMLARFHARNEAGVLVSGAAAFAAMWRQVTPFQPLGWLLQVPVVERAANRAYARFLRVRPRLQRWLVARTAARS
jgi:predicted DCC family thiol-disulfide oxidoreductase YuxK